jgi:integrase
MLLVAACLGLRCSEVLGLKWSDFDWEDLTLLVQRAVVAGHVDAVKTKYSKDRVPLAASLAAVLLRWRARTPFRQESDWVFASPYQEGRMPYREWNVYQHYLRPAGIKAGLGEGIGWHTLRHSYRSWLDETGAPMKVQQELMRHADIRTTMNIYGAAMDESKRRANDKVVEMVLAEKAG